MIVPSEHPIAISQTAEQRRYFVIANRLSRTAIPQRPLKARKLIPGVALLHQLEHKTLGQGPGHSGI